MTLLNFLPAGQYKNKGGGEWAGPCPKCGGTDRFVLWPEHHSGAPGGKFLCRGCAPEGGDGIQFLRDFQDMSYAEACAALRVEARTKRECAPGRSTTEAAAWSPKAASAPGGSWQARAAAFIAECVAQIEAGPGQAYLESRRLALETGRRFRLGWNPTDRYEAPEAWGLEPWRNGKGNLGKLYLPAGLVIPAFRKAGPVAVKIRRRDWQPGDEWPKYHAVKGGVSGAGLVLGKSGRPVVVVESELDALLVFQEAGDLCAALALGSASNRPDDLTTGLLCSAGRILCALDFDEAGRKAQRWWREQFPACAIYPPARGKDIGEMLAAGVPVRVWIEAGLAGETRQDAAPASEPARHEERTASVTNEAVNGGQEEEALSELLARIAPGPTPNYAAFCSEYHHGCFACPDYLAGPLRFCARYNHLGALQ